MPASLFVREKFYNLHIRILGAERGRGEEGKNTFFPSIFLLVLRQRRINCKNAVFSNECFFHFLCLLENMFADSLNLSPPVDLLVISSIFHQSRKGGREGVGEAPNFQNLIIL